MGMLFFLFSFLMAMSPQPRSEYQVALDRVWQAAQDEIYPQELFAKHFTEVKKKQLLRKLRNVENWAEFEDIINPFLLELGVSHTYFYSKENPDYYLFRSLFSTHNLATPKVYHAGMQTEKIGDRYFVRNVLEGFPAKKAGLQRGDEILTANNESFHPYHSFQNKKTVMLTFMRDKKINIVSVQTVHESPQLSFIKASSKSQKIFEQNGKKIGYFHLWTGTHDSSIEELKKATQSFKDTDAMILDLRDGFGGAWWKHLDLFFSDRSNFFVATVKNRSSEVIENKPEAQTNQAIYRKPLVVLINEGVRSGKEALAYQFKKTKRGFLIGSTTGGMFSMGKGLFADKEYDYIFYLSTAELFLDGQKIEGVGIQPDLEVPYPVNKTTANDPQLEAALKKAVSL